MTRIRLTNTILFVTFLIIVHVATTSAHPTSYFTLSTNPNSDNTTATSTTQSATPTTTPNSSPKKSSWPWWITPAGWGLVVYDCVAFMVLCWLWINGYLKGIWESEDRRRWRMQRAAARWWAEREEAGDLGDVEIRVDERTRRILIRHGEVEGEMRRMGMA